MRVYCIGCIRAGEFDEMYLECAGNRITKIIFDPNGRDIIVESLRVCGHIVPELLRK